MSHMSLPPPPVTNCHTFLDPLPLERDILYGRPLRLCSLQQRNKWEILGKILNRLPLAKCLDLPHDLAPTSQMSGSAPDPYSNFIYSSIQESRLLSYK